MAKVTIRIKDDQTDQEQLEDLTVDLRETVLEGPVDRVGRRSQAPTPDGARGADLIEIGVLIVQIALDTGLLSDLAERLQDWCTRRRVQSVEIEVGDSRLVLSDVSREQQQALVAHFIQTTCSSAN